jgi:hypothetical protein
MRRHSHNPKSSDQQLLHESQFKNINVVQKFDIISLDLLFYSEGRKNVSEELAAISLPPALVCEAAFQSSGGQADP